MSEIVSMPKRTGFVGRTQVQRWAAKLDGTYPC
jgi:hypothetical protein